MQIQPHIGTALTPNATKVLLLGGGELGKGLVLSMQKLGLEIHAVDRYEGSPAQQVAHFSYLADVTNDDEVWELAQRIKPDFVVPEVEVVAVNALRRLEEETDAMVVPSARACELTQDRESIRGVAESIGLPATAYRFATSTEELREAAEELGLPCIVKPDVATSGKGHMVVREEADLDSAWKKVHRVSSDSNRVVVERFVDFDYEVTLLAVRSVDPETGKLATWFSEPIGHRHKNGDLIESWQPMAMSEIALENARSVAARISNELGGRGVYGVELFVAGEEVFFSSVSPRPSDTAVLTSYTQRFSEFDLHARAILGYPIDVTMTSPGAAFILHAEEDAKEVAYSGVEDAMALSETDVQLFGKPGAYKGRRMGFVAVTADNADEARDRATLAASRIKVGLVPAADDEPTSVYNEPVKEEDVVSLDYVDEVEEDVVFVDPALDGSVDDITADNSSERS